jgi:polysaccharide chain length determinant protein (PEP-CTERM system associated)
MEHAPHVLDYLSIVRRRRWWLVLPVFASLAAGAALLEVLPKQYRASATLGVVAPSVSPTLVTQSALFEQQERIRALSQQLLSERVLLRVAEEEHLGSGNEARQFASGIRGRAKLTVPEPVAGTADARRLDMVVLSYTDTDPARAERIANRLASAFVEQSARTRTASAETTAAFFADQRERSRTRLAELEQQLRRAKEAFIGRLPEQTVANAQTLSGLRQQLTTHATSLRHEQGRLALIERQITARQQEAAKGVPAPTATFVPAVNERAIALQRELAAARANYTAKHPEIQRLESELRSALEQAPPPPPPPEMVAAAAPVLLQQDPAYRQLLSDRDTATLTIRELEHAMEVANGQIAEYSARVDAAPMVEQQLASLQRERDLAHKLYSDVSAKYEAAALAENVARNGDGEQFMVLEAATRPAVPTSPVPNRVMVLALLVGLCLGAAAALAREYLDRSVHSPHELSDEFGVPVLGEVAHIRA